MRVVISRQGRQKKPYFFLFIEDEKKKTIRTRISRGVSFNKFKYSYNLSDYVKDFAAMHTKSAKRKARSHVPGKTSYFADLN